jgi:DNA repair exonuclease SbcCD ATPase subunit
MIYDIRERSLICFLALSSTLADAEEQFATEIRLKQESINSVHSSLREASSALGEEKRRLGELQAKVSENADLDQKIANLRRSAAELRAKLAQNKKTDSTSKPLNNIRVGEADAGLEITPQLARIETNLDKMVNGDGGNPIPYLEPEQLALIAALPSPPILRARIQAYKADIDSLILNAKKLKSRSSELENCYRKIISLCTGVEEEKVEELLGNLLQAVMSEGKEDGEGDREVRIRGFLEIIRGAED